LKPSNGLNQSIKMPNIIYSKKIVDNANLPPVLEALFRKIGGLEGKISVGDKVLIKPNFVAPFPKATTDLALIDFFVSKIREIGGIPIIGESSGFEFDTEATFSILGIKKFAEERDVELINFEKQRYTKINLKNRLGVAEIADAAIDSRLIINLAVLKRHTITKVTGSVKNLFGLLSKPSRRHLHCHRLEEGISALALRFKRVIHVLDARDLLSRAVFGQPKPSNYILAGADPFALDHFGSRILGINPKEVQYLLKTESYKTDGEIPDTFPPYIKSISLKKRLHRMLYAMFYCLDEMKCSILGGNSILPILHWHFGVHPELGDVNESELKNLSMLCPVGAIDTKRGKIIKGKCIKVRCLRCYNELGPCKIILKGFNRPKKPE